MMLHRQLQSLESIRGVMMSSGRPLRSYRPVLISLIYDMWLLAGMAYWLRALGVHVLKRQ